MTSSNKIRGNKIYKNWIYLLDKNKFTLIIKDGIVIVYGIIPPQTGRFIVSKSAEDYDFFKELMK